MGSKIVIKLQESETTCLISQSRSRASSRHRVMNVGSQKTAPIADDGDLFVSASNSTAAMVHAEQSARSNKHPGAFLKNCSFAFI